MQSEPEAPAVGDPAERLRRLLEANRDIVAALGLDQVLLRVVAAAREIIGADYAALGVIGRDGSLEQFVHAGMDAATVAAIGDLPKGRGVLGALLNHPAPIRLPSIAQDPRSAGFPEHHPPMAAFLGLPIQLHDEVYGNLYLANAPAGGPFSAEDERLALALAAAAGTAIVNARLHREGQYRQTWLRASADITRRLAEATTRGAEVLQVVARSVLELAAADVVTVVLPDQDNPETLRVAVAVGLGQDQLPGLRYPAAGSVGQRVMQEQRGVIADDLDLDPDEGPHIHLRQIVPITQAMALPLQGPSGSHGAIVVGRLERRPFTPFDLEMADSFAGQAALALELVEVRSDRERLAVLEDRDRIARDLHEHVVQRLFSAGMRLEGSLGRVQDLEVRERLWETINDLDGTIRQVRTSIFALHGVGPSATSPRGRVLAVVKELAQVLGFEPRLTLDGPLDTLAAGPAAADIEAVVRESLSNVAKHAHARAVTVEVQATEQTLSVVVTDDGVGLGDSDRRSGLDNLRSRAEGRGGSLVLEPVAPSGLRVIWSVPTDL